MNNKLTTQYDARKFVEHFGGPDAMIGLWLGSGFQLTKYAIEKWVQRSSIPTSRILEAVQVAKRKRKPFNINDFVTRKKRKV